MDLLLKDIKEIMENALSVIFLIFSIIFHVISITAKCDGNAIDVVLESIREMIEKRAFLSFPKYF